MADISCYDNLISMLSREIQEEEDKRLINYLNAVARDTAFINKISFEELPLYINHEFETPAAKEILNYRIKTGKIYKISKKNAANFLNELF